MSEAGAVAEEGAPGGREAAPYYVGTLSLRSVRQAVRGLLLSVAAVGLWWGVVQASTSGHWDHPLTWLFCGLFGGIAFLFTLVAFGFVRGLVTGGVFYQVIDERGVRAWNPIWPYFIARARVDDITPSRRFLSRRVDVCVTFRTWRQFSGPMQLWTDNGMTLEEFEDLRHKLVSRGFG